MKNYWLLMTILSAAFAIGGCQQTDETVKDNAPAKEESKTRLPAADQTDSEPRKGAASPTEAVKIFSDGMKEKDPAKVKSVLTEGSIKMLEAGAKNEGADSVDEYVKSGKGESMVIDGEFRNEKIEGNRATLDVRSGGKWEPVSLVKENGEWKIAFEKN